MKTNYSGLEIAIIGISARFPESDDHLQFWNNLAEGREMIKTFTDDELKQRGVSEKDLQNKEYVKAEGVINNKDSFDNGFFEYNPAEAALMDPQTRLFHESCWKALEDAGYASETTTLKIGLFAGASENNNWKAHIYSSSEKGAIDPFLLSKISSANYMSTLISHKLNLRGPSVFIDTACSTSMAAIHMACRSLLTKECGIALAGGASVRTTIRKGYYYQEGGIFSRDGRCRAFDAEATGTLTGEGVGVVVLKRLSEAIKDGDNIYAVIRSTSLNNDGNLKVGYTAPSVTGQVDCLKAAYKLAGIDPSSVSYIEAHGTGTKLGDTIEIQGLNSAFNFNRNKHCAIGSVKTNIGHTDITAGIAGLIKTALALKFGKIPPSLHFNRANPEIDFASGPFYVNTVLTPWVRNNDIPLRAGVSSFGIGGTNVHAVLEEAPEAETSPGIRTYKLLTVSAKTERSVYKYMHHLKEFLLKEPALDLDDAAYTLQVGRRHFTYRKSIVFSGKDDLLKMLDKNPAQNNISRGRERSSPLIFMFSGQGAQYINMGKALYHDEPVFREIMDKGFSMIESMTGKDFKVVLFGEGSSPGKINETAYTQPIIFLFEYALSVLLASYGIKPQCMIGHSIGEYVAACISGVLTFEDALKLIVKRGELMAGILPGSMISVSLSEKEVLPFLEPGISLAAVNGPQQVVLSGSNEAIDQLTKKLQEKEILHIKLRTSHAFHSDMQDPIMAEFKKVLEQVVFNKPTVPFISNLTAEFITEQEAMSPDYWTRHMRHTVRFSAGIGRILSAYKDAVFVEAGPGYTLANLVKQHGIPQKSELPVVTTIVAEKESSLEKRHFSESIGKLWEWGINIDWNGYYGNEKRRRVSLPTYSFENNKFPAEVNPLAQIMSVKGQAPIQKKEELKDWIYYSIWKNTPILALKKEGIRHYLYFSTDDSFARGFSEELLRKKNNSIITVLKANSFKKHSRALYAVNPCDTTGFKKLFDALQADGVTITDILYSWGIGADANELDLKKGNSVMNLVFFSLVYIAQELFHRDELKGKNVTVITDALHQVTGQEKVSCLQSLLLGLLNVLRQEYPVNCRNIDLNLGEAQAGELSSVLATELENDFLKEQIVAIRHGQRWIRDYQKNTLPLEKETTTLKTGGVYLITGGLGNLGLIMASYLIKQYQARIIIVGRKKVSAGVNPGWQSRLDQLTALDKGVRYYEADVVSYSALKAVVEDIELNVGHIDGILHLAGVIDKNKFELIEDISYEKTVELFAAKIKGIQNIHRIFEHRRLDFVWISSSLASVLGGLTYSAYSSANLFMDHFISALPGGITNWKCVRLAEMALQPETINKQDDWDRSALKPSEIIQLFEWSLHLKNVPVITETTGDLFLRMERTFTPAALHDAGPDTAVLPEVVTERPHLDNECVEPVSVTEQKLKTLFESFFGMKGIGVTDDFFHLGGDSMKAMAVLRQIRQEFEFNITLASFFLQPTIRQIAAEIDLRQPVSMESV